MSISVCITANELRRALADLEAAEKNGFKYSLAVLRLTEGGRCLSDCVVEYEDLITRADPANWNLDWGRGDTWQYNKFVDGQLIPLTDEELKAQGVRGTYLSDGTKVDVKDSPGTQ